jgi:flagellar M-ring protein FliF
MENQKLGATQFQEQINYQRGLEGELARSIQSLAAVAAARVHLAIPKASVFLRDQQKPSASVIVTLHSGRTLDRAQVAGITHLVASSVPELPLKGVSVLDQNGNLLSANADSTGGMDPNQLGYVQQIEASTIKRIVDILEPIVGRSNVRAQVTAELDFSQSESSSESYKPNSTPDAAVVRSEQKSESSDQAGAAAAGRSFGFGSSMIAPMSLSFTPPHLCIPLHLITQGTWFSSLRGPSNFTNHLHLPPSINTNHPLAALRGTVRAFVVCGGVITHIWRTHHSTSNSQIFV